MLCRLTKPLGKAFITQGPSSFQVSANKLRNVTLTFHKVHTSRAFCLTAVKGQIQHAKGRGKDICLSQKWDSSCGFTPDWDRIAAVATSLSKSIGGGRGHIHIPQTGSHYGLHVTRKEVIGNVCFPGLYGPCSSGTMQTRASSTAAATKHREASDQQHKGDEQTLKDISSPPEKDPGGPEPAPDGGKPNKTQQLKKVFKEYGAVGVSFHICISLMSLGMFYLLVSSGIDMGALLCKLGFSETVVKSKMAAGTSTFVLAYAVHKLFAPVRISITLVSVPLIVRHFRKIGLFKAPPTAP